MRMSRRVLLLYRWPMTATYFATKTHSDRWSAGGHGDYQLCKQKLSPDLHYEFQEDEIFSEKSSTPYQELH
jgi:hypothetical protein